MEELFALQQQLAALQDVNTTNKLSDRVIVDLIEKLIKEYQLEVYHTMDGQHLITPTYLSKQIQEQINRHSRVSLTQLPELIGLSLDKIEAQIQLYSHNWDVTRVSDELFSNNYIIEMCEEINEDLQARQILPFADILQKYKIPSQFFKQRILQNLGTFIQGVVQDDKLTTSSYQDIQMAKLRGILRATIRPIKLKQISQDYQFENVTKTCDRLIQYKELDGKISQGTYYPMRFLENQEQITRKFFEQNKYVEYQMLQESLNINNPKEYLQGLFKDDVIILESCGFNKFQLNAIKDQLTELLNEEGYTCLADILPSILTEQDLDKLFDMMKLQNTEYANQYIFSYAYLDKLTQLFREKLFSLLSQNPQKTIEQQQQVEEDIQASAGGSSKNKKQNKKQQKKQQEKEIFSQKEVFDHLLATKELDYEDCIPDLYNFLVPRIQVFYEQVKVELFEKKKNANFQLIQDLQRRAEEMATGLLITQRSIQRISEQYQQIDTRILVDNCLFGYRLLIENLVVLLCKKHYVQLPQNLFTDAVKDKLEFGMQNAQRVFKNRNAMIESFTFLPKDIAKAFNEVLELYAKKAIQDLLKHPFLDVAGLKVSLDKKNDKNFLYFVKHQCKEQLKMPLDDRERFNQIVIGLLTEFGLYFVGNYDPKFLQIISQLLSEVYGQQKDQKETQTIILNILAAEPNQEIKDQVLALQQISKLL
ncbi:hypothetical protein pb186bvf_018541 [Paramecium bursaria]